MKPDIPPLDHPPYRSDIDGLRAMAILLVLGFHAFPAWAPGGFVGVDIFFVISGFLISGILLANLRDGHFSLSDFYARRIRRIFPALFLVLISVRHIWFFRLVAERIPLSRQTHRWWYGVYRQFYAGARIRLL